RGVSAVIVAGLGAIAIVRSAAQVGSMGIFSSSTRTAAVAQAESFDPGSYRIRVRLGQAYLARGDCARARVHARAAHNLFPSAAEPKRAIAACGGK
ncbi:MAG: hypothetical protein ABI205_07250, partial [Gemmatimonadaceae bacterium]